MIHRLIVLGTDEAALDERSPDRQGVSQRSGAATSVADRHCEAEVACLCRRAADDAVKAQA